MSLAEGSWLLAVAFLSLYACLAAIESGVAVKVMISRQTPVNWLFTPIWEITNVFLVFGFTIIAFLFSGSVAQLSHDLMLTLLLAASALALRAMTVLSVFYLEPKHFSRSLGVGLAALTVSIPMLLASAGVYFLTGNYFWQSTFGLTLIITALFGLLAGGFLFSDRYLPKTKVSHSQLTYFIWLGLLGGVLPLVSVYGKHELSSTAGAWLAGLAAIGIVAGLVHELRAHLWQLAAIISTSSLFVLAWFNRPYLVKGRLLLDQTFSGGAYAKLVLLASACMLPVLIFGFWLFAHLLRQKPSD